MSAPILHLTVSQRPMFLLNSCVSLFSVTNSRWLPLSLSYGVILPSSLTTLLPSACGFSPHLPVSVCGTGICFYTQSFSRLQPSVLPYSNFGPLRPGQPTPGSHPFEVSLCLNYRWLRNINRMCIGYAFRPDLSSRLTWSGRTFLQKP